MLFNRVT